MSKGDVRGKEPLVRAILWMFAIVTPLYWIAFFATGSLVPSPSDCGLRFELAFPVADLYMAVAAASGAIGLARQRWWGPPMALSAASAILYLALMDTTFDLENGVYLMARAQVALAALINLVCFASAGYLSYAILRNEEFDSSRRRRGAL